MSAYEWEWRRLFDGMICGECKIFLNFSRKLLSFSRLALRNVATSSYLRCNEVNKKDTLDDLIERLPPYPRFTAEERKYLYRGIVDEEVSLRDEPTPANPANPNEAPFDEIYADGPDRGNFTKVNVVTEKQPELWYWVERLLKKNVSPDPKGSDNPLPSGYVPPSAEPPELPYFVPRTRNKLYPVYKEVTTKTTKSQFEKPIGYDKWLADQKKAKEVEVLTQIRGIQGDIRLFDMELKRFLEEKYETRIRSSVNEYNGTVLMIGDYVRDVVSWLEQRGF